MTLEETITQLMLEASQECDELDKHRPQCGDYHYAQYLKKYNYAKGKRNAYSNVLIEITLMSVED